MKRAKRCATGRSGDSAGRCLRDSLSEPESEGTRQIPDPKPILLLERISQISAEPGNRILEPFCGSGTTLVAAKLLERCAVSINSAPEAIELTGCRLREMIKTDSRLMQKGRVEYQKRDSTALDALRGLGFFPVQRDRGVDAILKEQVNGKSVFVRVQQTDEALGDAISALRKAGRNKGDALLLRVVTEENRLPLEIEMTNDVYLIYSAAAGIAALLGRLKEEAQAL